MALKADRYEKWVDISFFCNTVAERGGIACVDTSKTNSGVSMDDANAIVTYQALSSGSRPVGLLLNDVVNYDLTRQHINWLKDEMQVGGKVALLRIGIVSTNLIVAAATPTAGAAAYVGVSGLLDTTSTGFNTKVGQFLSAKDADGYAKVSININ
jgi:hypothetical protein